MGRFLGKSWEGEESEEQNKVAIHSMDRFLGRQQLNRATSQYSRRRPSVLVSTTKLVGRGPVPRRSLGGGGLPDGLGASPGPVMSNEDLVNWADTSAEP